MITKENKQMSDSFMVGGLLAIVGGFLDAYTYIIRGNVFANAQTGNIVLMGINIANGNIKKSVYYLIPIFAFVLGVIIAEIVKKKYKYDEKVHWRQISVLIELIVLFFVGFLKSGRANMVANVLISFVCSMQVESFRKINGSAYATTMCTGNLRSATEWMCKYIFQKDKKARSKSIEYYFIIILFIIGAMIGSIFTNYIGEKAVWFCSGILLVVFLAMFVKKNIDKSKSSDIMKIVFRNN